MMTFAGFRSFFRILIVLSIGVLMYSCSDSNSWKKVDVSQIKADFIISRFDQDFYALDTNHLDEGESRLKAKYGSFYQDYITGIMNFGQPASRFDTVKHDPREDMIHFLSNASDRGLYDTVQKDYRDMSDLQAQLSEGFKHFRYYFPEKAAVKKVYTFISEFHNGAITYSDSVIGIGLDMYLGENYIYYGSVDFPQFMRRKLCRRYIVPNVMEVMYNLHFDKAAYNAELPLIEAMINEGKRYYYLECMMPDAPDSIIMGYTPKQEEWCRNSERSIWQYFNEQDLLYKVNYMDQKRYTSDGPTTTGMPPESPPKVGSWVGWQIVRKFMKNSGGKVTLPQLLDKYSAKQIFTMANYKPK